MDTVHHNASSVGPLNLFSWVQVVMQARGAALNTDEFLLSCPLLTSCYVAQFLTGYRLVQVHGPGVVPCFTWLGKNTFIQQIRHGIL